MMTGVSRPIISKPAPWVVAKRIRANEKLCEECGHPFQPRRSAHRFCSHDCHYHSISRDRPADFEQVFVRIGRLACQEHYGARRKAVTRWLEECGLFRLTEARREFRRQRATEARIGSTKAKRVRQLEVETEEALQLVPSHIAALAADYLRSRDGGSWPVSQTPDGDWIVGIVAKSPSQLLAKAERHGFMWRDADLRGEGDVEVGSAG